LLSQYIKNYVVRNEKTNTTLCYLAALASYAASIFLVIYHC